MAEASVLAALSVVGAVLTAAVFGGMVFFAAVYAPLVFTKLPAATAGAFIRAVFPVYYKVMGAAAIVAGLLLLPSANGVVMAVIGAVFVVVMLLLMPRINAARDASLAGGGREHRSAQARRFTGLHRLSVVINFVQMLAVLAVLVGLLT